MSEPVDAMLVGSVPLGDAEEVLRICGTTLGDSVGALPDGETGERTVWTVFQAMKVFAQHPQLTTVNQPSGEGERPDWWIPTGFEDLWDFRIKDGEGEITFGELGYADYARASYEVFTRLRGEGVIPDGVRFQVSLPLPEDATSWFFRDPAHLARVTEPYERALVAELDGIVSSIPAPDLSLQWDVCWEVLDAEGIFPWTPTDVAPPLERLQDTVARLSPHIPADALLGYHLCYADLGHRHMKEPESLANVVTIANMLVKSSGRAVDYFHMPVPRGRDDDPYFAPLEQLDIGDARLFLGLIHHTDGLPGARRRVAAARRHLSGFGVATECGFGRRPSEQVEPLLHLHREVAAELHRN